MMSAMNSAIAADHALTLADLSELQRHQQQDDAAGQPGSQTHAADARLLASTCSTAKVLLAQARRLHTSRPAQQGAACESRRLTSCAAWTAARLQAAQMHAATFVRLLHACLSLHMAQPDAAASSTRDSMLAGSASQTEMAPAPAQAQGGHWRLLVSALLAVPAAVGPPGAHVAARGLRLLFSNALFTPVATAGAARCQRLPSQHPELAQAALGDGTTAQQALAAAQDPEARRAMGAMLAHAYATAWCGADCAAAAAGATGALQQQADHQQVASADSPLPSESSKVPVQPWAADLSAEGRRLPAPPDWFLLALALPSASSTSAAAGGAASKQGPDRGGGASTGCGAAQGAGDADAAVAAVMSGAALWLCGLQALQLLPGRATKQPVAFSDDPALAADEVRAHVPSLRFFSCMQASDQTSWRLAMLA